MKNLKTSATLLLGLLVATSGIAQQAEKSLVKSFSLLGNQTLVIDLEGPVEVKTWKNNSVRVQMDIELYNRPVTFLKGMIMAGRYNLKSTQIEEGLLIKAPGMEREVKLKGEELKEKLAYVVFAPENVQVIMANEGSSSLEPAELSDKIK